MLKLLIFAPCEKVIIGEAGQSSVIGVIEMIRLQVNMDEPIPSDALIPFRWGFLVLWNRDQPIEQPIKYQEQIRIFRPDGTDTGFHADAEFEVNMTFKNFRQHNDNIPVFPAGTEGPYELKLFLRRAGEEPWEERGRFPVIIEHIKPNTEKQDGQQKS
jgi:hypothetical protein